MDVVSVQRTFPSDGLMAFSPCCQSKAVCYNFIVHKETTTAAAVAPRADVHGGRMSQPPFAACCGNRLEADLKLRSPRTVLHLFWQRSCSFNPYCCC